ncbi:MAG TPA: maleylpyruvate isomerase family mycothiol-dependent enzyme [Streptosporangiaceae bacterium]|nr:maleylpyruvate isomerase family mycothiol-dependent enzyme [Streptosporangiaceae bacterium]
MSAISADRLSAEIVGSTATLAGLVDGADLTRPVPTCPAWTLRQLTTHVGRAHRWAGAIVVTRSAEPIAFRDVPDGKLPEDPRQHADWLRAGAARLVEAVRDAGDAPVWTHQGVGPARYWMRRMAHETSVHRADAQLAFGLRPQIDALTAADGIAEWLGFLAAPGAGSTRPPLTALDGRVLHIHATDDGLDGSGEWLIRPGDGRVDVTPGHAKGDVAVRGPASDLLLVLMRRLPATDPAVQVLGDTALLDALLAAIAF